MLAGIPLSTKQWDWDYFLEQRRNVLGLWPTGASLMGNQAIADGIAYHKAQPWWKYASLRNERAQAEGRIQIVPQVGHALVEQTVEHIARSEDLGPDRWYVLTDTYTRKSEYQKAAEAVDRSRKAGSSYLNGYPLVAHGIAGARAINECTRAAIGSDNNDEDARLPAEFALAGGWTWGTIKRIEELIQHSRDYHVDRNIHNQQYIDRLAAHYTENGIPILRRASANLPGWDSLGFKVTVSLLEVLLSAAQGVKHIDLSLGIGMNLVQDAAAIQSLRSLAREFLDRLGQSAGLGHARIQSYGVASRIAVVRRAGRKIHRSQPRPRHEPHPGHRGDPGPAQTRTRISRQGGVHRCQDIFVDLFLPRRLAARARSDGGATVVERDRVGARRLQWHDHQVA